MSGKWFDSTWFLVQELFWWENLPHKVQWNLPSSGLFATNCSNSLGSRKLHPVIEEVNVIKEIQINNFYISENFIFSWFCQIPLFKKLRSKNAWLKKKHECKENVIIVKFISNSTWMQLAVYSFYVSTVCECLAWS